MNKTVLIVDDEPEICRMLSRALERAGYNTLQANSGMEALVLIQEHSIDLLITDVRMPGISGLDLIKQTHEIEPRIPIVVISGYGTLDTAIESIRRGAFFFINKPFDTANILDVVAKGMRLPHVYEDEGSTIENAVHTMEFSLPPDLERVRGAINQVSVVTKIMGYPMRWQNVIVPFVVDELLVRAVNRAKENGSSNPIKASVVVSSQEVLVKVEAPQTTYDPQTLLRTMEDTDFNNPTDVGLQMTHYFCEKLSFSEDGSAAEAVVKNKSR